MKRISGRWIAGGILAGLLFAGPGLRAEGKWEFGFHYSRWSLNIIKSHVEDSLNDTVASDLKDKILDDIRADYPSLMERGYSQRTVFDSSGDNYGAEVRYYPGGRSGSFSVGFSIERTSMKVAVPEASVKLDLEDSITHTTGAFTGDAFGEFLLKPTSFHLSLRWDIFPSAGLHPYVTFGVGASTAKAIDTAIYSYEYTGELSVPGGPSRAYADGETKTLRELIDEQEAKDEDFVLPVNFVPFVQLNIGLKGRLTENLHLLVDAGVWDGFLLRAGLAFRF
jgi:hypothetical protein